MSSYIIEPSMLSRCPEQHGLYGSSTPLSIKKLSDRKHRYQWVRGADMNPCIGLNAFSSRLFILPHFCYALCAQSLPLSTHKTYRK